MSLRKKILEIDIELKNNYENKRINEEFQLFNKARKTKSVLYNCIKQKKTSNKIWPFVKNNKVIEHDPHKTLRDQYESVFSKPRPDFLVEDTEYFNTEECDYSDNGSLFGIHEV